MLAITYVYSYFGAHERREPPAKIRQEAERTRDLLHPNRTQTYSCGERGGLRAGDPRTNPCWIVTFEPVPEPPQDVNTETAYGRTVQHGFSVKVF